MEVKVLWAGKMVKYYIQGGGTMTDLSGKKEMVWEKMVELFPGLWVFVTDCQLPIPKGNGLVR